MTESSSAAVTASDAGDAKGVSSTAAPDNSSASSPDPRLVSVLAQSINNNNLAKFSILQITKPDGSKFELVEKKLTGPHCPKCERTFVSYTEQEGMRTTVCAFLICSYLSAQSQAVRKSSRRQGRTEGRDFVSARSATVPGKLPAKQADCDQRGQERWRQQQRSAQYYSGRGRNQALPPTAVLRSGAFPRVLHCNKVIASSRSRSPSTTLSVGIPSSQNCKAAI